MLKSYSKTAIRFILKNKTFGFINILGLAIGTLCCLYIIFYVNDQYSYDSHLADAKDIYRVTWYGKIPGNNPALVGTCSPAIAPNMKKDFGEVQQFTRVIKTDDLGAQQNLLSYREKSFYETQAFYADSTFFNIFNYHFLNGDPSTALTGAYSVVLEKAVAEKLFGTQDPIGKLITIDNIYGKHDFKVTGIIDEDLGKSHLHANFIMSMHSGGMGEYASQDQAWAGDNFTFSYVKLIPNANPLHLEAKLPAFLNKYGSEQLKSFGMTKILHLQPVRKIHTTTGYNHDQDSVSSSFLYLLLFIGALIQVIACINFMNLSTARASQRAIEVGIRKVVGAGRKNLMIQFLGESFLTSLISVGIALPLLIFAMPYLNWITQANITLSFFTDYRLWLILTGLVILTGLIAGSYPAFYLSQFQVNQVLKGRFTNRLSAASLRRYLVVFQFALSTTLIISIIVIHQQMNYIKSRDLGFDKDQIMLFSFYTGEEQKRIPAFMNDLRALAEVRYVSQADNPLGQYIAKDWEYSLKGGNVTTGQDTKLIFSDENYVKANGIKLVSGRDFSPSDSSKVLINQTFARKLGLTSDNAIGQRLIPRHAPNQPESYVEIAGVMKDFNFNSLRDEINSFMLVYTDKNVKAELEQTENKSTIIVNTGSNNYQSLIEKMKILWRNHFPSLPFEFRFQNDLVANQYKTEIVLSRIINSFTIIATIISCLGLFGLAAFSADQRIKEIGIRKVLGASVGGLIRLLTFDFLKSIFLALAVAIPLSSWIMGKWLQKYAYRIGITWQIFVLAGLLTLFVALITVGFQALKAALANPVKNLRNV